MNSAVLFLIPWQFKINILKFPNVSCGLIRGFDGSLDDDDIDETLGFVSERDFGQVESLGVQHLRPGGCGNEVWVGEGIELAES